MMLRPQVPHKIRPIVRNDGVAEQTMRAWMDGVTGFYDFFARRIKVINKLDDFDVQNDTEITLESGYTYIIGDIITTPKGFVATGGFSMTAFNGAYNILTYTGTGTMFTMVDCIGGALDIGISFPNGKLIDFTGTGISVFERCTFFEGKDIGTFNGTSFTNMNWSNCTFFLITGQGLVFNDDIFVISLTRVFWNSTSASHVAIDISNATVTTMEIRDYEPQGVSGSIALKGLASSANIVAGNIATVESSNFKNSAMTPLSGISISDVRFEFSDCGGLRDTISDAIIYFRNNASNTTFAAVNTPTKVVGTWVTERLSKFDHSTNGRIVSLSEREVVFPVDISVYVKATTGTPVDVVLHLYINGVLSSAATAYGTVNNTSATRMTIPWQCLLDEGEYIEVWIENKTNGNAVLVVDATMRIK